MKVKIKKGFSLIELTLASAILVVILIGILLTYILCFELNEISRNLTLANNALQAQLEVVREVPFDNLAALDQTTFALNGFSAGESQGLIDIYDTAYSDLKYVRLVGCWKQKSGRVIGEDSNLDGVLAPAEDINLDGAMSSAAEIITLISKIN